MSEIFNSNPENIGQVAEVDSRTKFSEEEKLSAFSQIEEIISRFDKIGKERDPEKWYRPMAKEFLRLSNRPQDLHPLVRNFILEFSPTILEAFKEELDETSPEGQEKIIDIYSSVKNFAEKIQPGIEQEKTPFDTISFEQLERTGKISVEELEGKKTIKIQLDGETMVVPFPQEGVLYKGGVARIIAKVFTSSNIEGETSRTDIDLIVKKGNRPVGEIVEDYGASITDTELVDEIDEGRILATRDVDMNAVLVSENGLLLTEAAKKACQTRIIHPLLPKERELFGRSTFKVGDINLTRNVLLYRLVRMVVDNKAGAFEIKQAETQVPLGIYWLILARNYLRKSERVQNIGRLYEIAKEMNQTEEAQNPVEWLEKLHQEYPDFDFQSHGLSKQEYARWMFGKFLKLVAQKYRHSSKLFQQDFTIENPDTALQLVKIPEVQNAKFDIDDAMIQEFLDKSKESQEK